MKFILSLQKAVIVFFVITILVLLLLTVILFALISIAIGGTLIINWIVNLFLPGLN